MQSPNAKNRWPKQEKQAAVERGHENRTSRLNETVAKLKEKAKSRKEAAVKREVKKALEEAETSGGKTTCRQASHLRAISATTQPETGEGINGIKRPAGTNSLFTPFNVITGIILLIGG